MVVVVTSRTSVADRARLPEGTVALRLEPFDDRRVAAWLDTWNTANGGHFADRGVTPLDLPTVLAHRELAEQPLLLLMLALYDADGNALRSAGALRPDELYERLLRRFARREVTKHRPGMPGAELDRAVEDELRRLSVVAFAMFNRSAQWVTEAELEADLAALSGNSGGGGHPSPGLRAPLRPAEIVLGRFFFVHRAQATRDDDRLETYEFLHATFGEFLVARFTWQVLGDVAAREAAATMSFGVNPVDDDLLHALLSYSALSGRAPVIGFLAALASGLDAERRRALTELLVRLFRAAQHTRMARRHENYQPRPLPAPARHAAYSANLLLLAVGTGGALRGSELYPGRNVVSCWHRDTLLWQSQLTSQDWTSLVSTLTLDRLRTDDHDRDIALAITTDREPRSVPPIDPIWTWEFGTRHDVASWIRQGAPFPEMSRTAHFQCGLHGDVLVHALEPLANGLPSAVNSFGPAASGVSSLAAELSRLLLLPPNDPVHRRQLYLRCAAFGMHIDGPEFLSLIGLLLDRLAVDWELPADLIMNIFGESGWTLNQPGPLTNRFLRCLLAFAGRDPAVDPQLGRRLAWVLHYADEATMDPILAAEAVARLVELAFYGKADQCSGPDEPDAGQTDWIALARELVARPALAAVLAVRPDLRARLEHATSHPLSSSRS